MLISLPITVIDWLIKCIKNDPSRAWRVNPFSAGTVFIRQILTYKDGPRAERITIFIKAVDP